MFLRFGYAVGNVGPFGTLLIILLGHLVTIPTALAIAEIATNRRVEGWGEYFIISRSFGTAMGVTVLWFVVTTLGASLVLFFLGHPVSGVAPEALAPFSTIANADPLVYVFSIVFPAFTGMTAGVGLSGDLANPRRSIPRGILTATLAGIVVYVAVVLKLAFSASPELLAGDQLVMSRIALWGPIIPIGLAAATISSAIGSILVAPRTLQALSLDGVAPSAVVNRTLAAGVGKTNDPRNATLLTAALALVTVARRNIHIWLTWHDYDNANLMILLAYILLGHPDWKNAEISIFAALPKDEVAEETAKLEALITEGRLPITRRHLRIFPTVEETDFSSLVERLSGAADLVVLGFTEERIQEKGRELFLRQPELRDVLFVSARQRIVIE